MKTPFSLGALWEQWILLWHRHQVLIVILFFLSILAGVSHLSLLGSLLGSSSGTGPSSVDWRVDARTCTSTGTVFGDLETLKEATDLFQKRVSKVVAEREDYLNKPSSWACPSAGDDGITELTALAGDMPGWHTIPAVGTKVKMRPVTFSAFSSIISEFEREYECKLNEFSYSADAMVRNNLDLDDPKLYCCNSHALCVQATSDVSCSTVRSDDETCGGSCVIGVGQEVFAARMGPFKTRIERDKQRARLAVLRTIHALRPFELSYTYARELSCFQRIALDLRQELGLLGNAVSCMPKIWDAMTSLHDTDDSLKPGSSSSSNSSNSSNSSFFSFPSSSPPSSLSSS